MSAFMDRPVSVERRVIDAIQDEFALRAQAVTPTADLKRDLRLDSLDMFSLSRAIESEFGIDVADGDPEQWTTVESVVAYVVGKGIL